jgi:hypothetical protein
VVYAFGRSSKGSWQEMARLRASNGGADDRYGASVALSADGTTIAVGAVAESSASTGTSPNPNDNSAAGAGAVYVVQ